MGNTKNIATLILAAGSSSRLGEAKQLLRYQNKTLLYHACKKALNICDDVYVVLGAEYEKCKMQINDLDINIIENKNYNDGLSSSIKAGIIKLKEYEKTLIVLCDQPFIDETHFQNLIDKSKDSSKIICSFYNNDVAVPAIFPKEVYGKLLKLEADKGAKKIIKNNKYEKVLLDDNLAIDIDTKDDKKYLDRK